MGAEQSQLEKLEAADFRQNYISFFVNGEEHNVNVGGLDPDIGPNYVLVDFLREKIGKVGCKINCRAGGCGVCLVSIKSTHPVTGQDYVRSANSCLLPLYACDGLEITTVEGLGNRRVGYSIVHERLRQFGGTQCGFCTPGFVMNMHSIMQSNPKFTTSDVENSFDGNICRCTGYRPIMDAFKSLAINPAEDLQWKCNDIEDVYKCPIKKLQNGQDPSLEKPEIIHVQRNLFLKSPSGQEWFKVTTLVTLYDILHSLTTLRVKYRLVAGNTGTGVYKNDGPYDGYIDINNVPELQYTSITEGVLVLGGGVTLSEAINVFDRAEQTGNFVYAKEFYRHMWRVAALPVRNRATVAGNLMLKHAHPEFISDLFVLFESVGATITIGSSSTLLKQYTLLEFLELDMTGKVILALQLPALSAQTCFYKCYKLGKRHQNSSALVNCGILLPIDRNSLTVVKRPRICFGGISSKFVHANETEEYLQGKSLHGAATILQKALMILGKEVNPDPNPTGGSIEYRRGLAQSYFYRCLLSVSGDSVDSRLRSGADEIPRKSKTGRQIFDTDRTKWPLNQPLPKLESLPQISGEAKYIDDMAAKLDELFGAFVVSTVGNATIKSIDASQALRVPGVVSFYTAKDIPGTNNFTAILRYPEEVFAESFVRYAGQSIGLLVARTRQIALEARNLVKIQYENYQPPVIEVAEAVNNLPKDFNLSEESDKLSNMLFPCKGLNKKTTDDIIQAIKDKNSTRVESEKLQEGGNSLYKIKGEFQTSAQYHFYTENQSTLCIPKENCFEMWTSTQWMENVQVGVATVLNVPLNYVIINMKRIGGGFGGKSSRNTLIASACAVAAYHTNRPVRVVLDLETNMQMLGKRLPYLAKYEVEVDETGKIHKLKSDIFCNAGAVPNEPTSLYAMICSQNCYRATNWNASPGVVTTNTASNTYCRSPGSSAGIAIIETIMEHIAHVVRRDPLLVREVNFIHKGDPLIGVPGARLVLPNPVPAMIASLKADCDYDSRKRYIDEFNRSNRWKKRGISIVPHRFPNVYGDVRMPAFIAVYHLDGTVNVSHAGIEMGQGINTKVAQVVAYTLQIPVDKVKIQTTNNIISPNNAVSAGSVASELVCNAARNACLQLLERLAPIRKSLINPTWEELIAAANAREILLTSQFQGQQGDIRSYDIWGVVCLEMEVDILTGDYKIVRVDMVEDAGQSISPLVDLGQIEGAFIMGLGWWLTEELIYDNSTGALLTDNTWTYKPMMSADIPEDFRVTILKNAPNPFGVLSSKATGEPTFNMGVASIFALRQAIDSARRDVGVHSWYQMDGPVTHEKVRQLALTSAEYFTFQ